MQQSDGSHQDHDRHKGQSEAFALADVLHPIILSTRVPPGNRLEALKGDLRGKQSIRVNYRWRIVFRWKDGDAYDVEVDDYH